MEAIMSSAWGRRVFGYGLVAWFCWCVFGALDSISVMFWLPARPRLCCERKYGLVMRDQPVA